MKDQKRAKRRNRWNKRQRVSRKFKRLVRRLKCKHDYVFVRNIYGDEINMRATAKKIYRSVWVCTECGRQQLREIMR